MNRDGGRLYELVEWIPSRRNMDARRFNVITWIAHLTTVGTTWQREHMARREAVILFAQMKRGSIG